MWERQVVEFVTTDYERREYQSPDRFTLRPDLKYVWLQRAAIWVLRKLGCYAMLTETTAIRKTLDTTGIAERLWKMDSEVFMIYNRHGEHLLVGQQEFADIASGFSMNHPFSVDLQYAWVEPGRYPPDAIPKPSIRGMKVTVIPWMKGMLVLPKGWNE